MLFRDARDCIAIIYAFVRANPGIQTGHRVEIQWWVSRNCANIALQCSSRIFPAAQFASAITERNRSGIGDSNASERLQTVGVASNRVESCSAVRRSQAENAAADGLRCLLSLLRIINRIEVGTRARVGI